MWTAMGLRSGSKGVSTPGLKAAVSPLDGPELDAEQAAQYKSLAMRAVYLSLDRPDIQFSTKETARAMTRPTVSAWEALKRIARYLLMHPRLIWVYERQDPKKFVDGRCDSDWAGCKITRKSSSSLSLRYGNHLIGYSATTQAVLALSSGDAEFYSAVKGANKTIGTSKMYVDLVRRSSRAYGRTARRRRGSPADEELERFGTSTRQPCGCSSGSAGSGLRSTRLTARRTRRTLGRSTWSVVPWSVALR
jgi:hypothetical protein